MANIKAQISESDLALILSHLKLNTASPAATGFVCAHCKTYNPLPESALRTEKSDTCPPTRPSTPTMVPPTRSSTPTAVPTAILPPAPITPRATTVATPWRPVTTMPSSYRATTVSTCPRPVAPAPTTPSRKPTLSHVDPPPPGPHYVVTSGLATGIFHDWTLEVSPLVLHVPGAVYKKYATYTEAAAVWKAACEATE